MNKYAVYVNNTDAPPDRRTHNGILLTITQMNQLARRAHELGTHTTIPDAQRIADGSEYEATGETRPDGSQVLRQREQGEEFTVKGGDIITENMEAALQEFENTHEVIGNAWIKKDEVKN